MDQAWTAFRAGDLAASASLCEQVLSFHPFHWDAIRLVAYSRLNLGRINETLAVCQQALNSRPGDPEISNILGVALQRQGRIAESIAPLQAATVPGNSAEPFYNLAIALMHTGRPAEALASFERALSIEPRMVPAMSNAALCLSNLNRLDEALAVYNRAIAVEPDNPFSINDRGALLDRMGRAAEAFADFDRATQLRPDFAMIWFNRGCALGHLGRVQEALESYDRSLALQPDYAAAHTNRGVALHQMRRYAEALAAQERALALEPNSPAALKNKAVVLTTTGHPAEALELLGRAAQITPDDPEVHYNAGVALGDLKRSAESLAAYDRALQLNPNYLEAKNNRGMALLDLSRYDEALAAYELTLASDPKGRMGMCGAALCSIRLCDWDRRDRYSVLLAEGVENLDKDIAPFALLCYGEPPAVQLKGAETYLRGKIPDMPAPLWRGERWKNKRIKVAYLSADYRRHPMGHLTVELFELHDRKKFEIHAVSFYGPDDSDVQARIKAAADAFHDVSAMTDPQVAALLHELKIDIAVDLMAHTQHARPAILAHRPAPVQINYLGYPATMGGTFTDYIIADPIVLPMDQQPYYSEQIVHLPHSYQANDSRRPISEWKPTRAELGLPEKGFVFCCFNNTWKMTREIFEIWMRLLQAVPGSVLWLYRDHPEAARNLKAAAGARGVDPDRIVFAGPVKLEDHLARHRAADLFLDTLPYNAHTTCSDTLWAGLPIVTCKGDTFAGRVAASLLTSVGLPELITETLEDYEALALALANDPRRLKKIRAKLAAQRDTSALFDTKTFTRDLEAIYQRMWQTWQGRKT